jgi:RNA polymerase sigma factor (sigma-70 family)
VKSELPVLTENQKKLLGSTNVIPDLVAQMANNNAGVNEHDLTDVGRDAEWRAAAIWDSAKDERFAAFLWPRAARAMRRHISRVRGRNVRKQGGLIDVSHDHIEVAPLRGNVLHDSPEEAREHVLGYLGGIFEACRVGFVSMASIAPANEDELHDRMEEEQARANLATDIERLGSKGIVLKLRHLDELPWEQVAARLERSEASVKRDAQKAIDTLAAERLAATG